MEQNTSPTGASKESLWYLDNYILLKDYYDRTISRIAARCVRMGNIAMEEYKFYGYILDVLEEISETGDYILEHKELYPYVEKKIAGGVEALKKNLAEYQLELQNNSSPDMIKEDAHEVEKLRDALGEFDKTVDPTVGAGMNMDQLMEKLMAQNNIEQNAYEQPQDVPPIQPASALTQPQPAQAQVAQQPSTQAQTASPASPQTAPSAQHSQQQAQPSSVNAGQSTNQTHELKKVIKIKKPINPDTQQAVPAKNEVK